MTTNALATEKSPYLLQHAHNPVEWYPWGEEAFAKARRENKPIFLSVGYSTCHWCHVMAHESFENPAIAKLMNEHFVNVKVDREERPDVDRVYMTYVQATSGGGGWPMSVFLTPELKPFFGGTYFPPEDRYGRPGFPTLLQRLAEAWEKDRETVTTAAANAIETLREYSSSGATKADAIGKETLAAAFAQFARTFDDELGGFGGAPKFPRPVALNFLFRYHARESADSKDGKLAASMALLTLRKMAEGGMHDQLGGGFHRYSVDRFWHVPHYEKMLYDQAQLASSYIDAFQITGDAQYATTARDILDYVRRDLTDKSGGFFSAEDADSLVENGKPEHREGAFYVWTKEEIAAALGDETTAIFDRFYGVEEGGNSPAGSDPHGELTGKNTLIRRMTEAEAAKAAGKTEAEIELLLASAKSKLLEVRSRRPRPHLDDKIITAWNGLMISAFARAGQALDEPAYIGAAQNSARFIRQELWKNGTLFRSYRQGASAVKGFCDDYAFLIAGLLDLYGADFDIGWLKWALELQARQDALFGDEHGGYFSVAEGDASILLRMKEDYDGAEPSPNSVAALNLLRLAQLTERPELRDRATKTLDAFSAQLTKAPTSVPQMLAALDASLAIPKQIVIAGQLRAEDTVALLREIHARYFPNTLLLLADGGAGQKWLGERLEFLRGVGPIDGKAAAFVCERFTCQLPVTDPRKLRELLLQTK
ncbi:MAG: thioredoxin domain-containing protein [Chthoniobacteraceae bacterium]